MGKLICAALLIVFLGAHVAQAAFLSDLLESLASHTFNRLDYRIHYDIFAQDAAEGYNEVEKDSNDLVSSCDWNDNGELDGSGVCRANHYMMFKQGVKLPNKYIALLTAQQLSAPILELTCRASNEENVCLYPCTWTPPVHNEPLGYCALSTLVVEHDKGIEATHCAGTEAAAWDICTNMGPRKDCLRRHECSYENTTMSCYPKFWSKFDEQKQESWLVKYNSADIHVWGCCDVTKARNTTRSVCQEVGGTCYPQRYCTPTPADEIMDPVTDNTCKLTDDGEIIAFFGRDTVFSRMYSEINTECSSKSEDACGSHKPFKVDWRLLLQYATMNVPNRQLALESCVVNATEILSK